MKKLSKKWKIFIITMVVLVGSIYGYYKINNRNAFEEMYNSYYNLLPLGAVDNMPQIR
ncbi:TipC family immunity protein [Gemella morbillorum]|uniref:TipC family immunity protein n=1 Tax=Gemella morbillorum TaxID=29391 RepID=UPI0023F3A431|nr:TipC family immunity protein [Gemella morbillorum]